MLEADARWNWIILGVEKCTKHLGTFLGTSECLYVAHMHHPCSRVARFVRAGHVLFCPCVPDTEHWCKHRETFYAWSLSFSRSFFSCLQHHTGTSVGRPDHKRLHHGPGPARRTREIGSRQDTLRIRHDRDGRHVPDRHHFVSFILWTLVKDSNLKIRFDVLLYVLRYLKNGQFSAVQCTINM